MLRLSRFSAARSLAARQASAALLPHSARPLSTEAPKPETPAAAPTTAPAAAAASPAAATSAAAAKPEPKISKPDEEPFEDAGSSAAGSGFKRVLYSTLFLTMVGVAGTLYHAANDEPFRNKLKASAPMLPWDALAAGTKTVESTVVTVAKQAEVKVKEAVRETVSAPAPARVAAPTPAPVQREVAAPAPAAKAEEPVVPAATPAPEQPAAPAAKKQPAKRAASPAREAKAARAPEEPVAAAAAATTAEAVVPVEAAAAAVVAAASTAAATVAAAKGAEEAPAKVQAALESLSGADAALLVEDAAPRKRPEGRSKAVDSLQHSLNRLNAIMSALAQTSPSVRPSYNKIREVLQSAEHDLDAVATQLDLLTDEQNELVTAVLAQQAEEFRAVLATHEDALRAQFAAERAQVEAAGAAALASEEGKHAATLAAYEQQWAAATRELLSTQAKELEATWRRQLQDRLDHERSGRLARLDHLTLKLKYLEKICFINAEKLHSSYHVHSLYSALQALHATLFDTSAAGRTAARSMPFRAQWELLRKLTLGDELMRSVLDTVDADTQNAGIASFPELHVRFTQSVVPEVRRAALLPASGENDSVQSLAALVASMLPESSAAGDAIRTAAAKSGATAQGTDVPPVGFLSYTVSRALSALMIPKTPALYKEGGVESVLARVEWHLQREDLEAATRELNALAGWPKILAEGWLREARRHLEVKMAMEVLQTQVGLMSLGAV
ncbi:MICOS complex subunit mic60 [Blastocladiella emersonii ATCC 22665]|nr:MICOS complex subunit mic60 [Blastocladiella emersonii ATCC 22665]